MDFAYAPGEWEVLFAAVAGAAAAMTGLLFVAFSVNLSTILADPAHMARSRETLSGLLTLLVLSIVVLIPGQGRVALGAELTVMGLLLLIISLSLQARTIRRLHIRHRVRWMLRASGLNAPTSAVAIAGIGLLTRSLGGLLWLVPTILIYFIWSTVNAWSLVVQAATEPPATSRDGADAAARQDVSADRGHD